MIEVRGLVKKYGGVTALDGLGFRAEPGRVTGFLGLNGAGKSTTMRILLGLDRPDGGHALVDGKPYGSLREPLRTVGALLESGGAAHPGRSAYHHLRALAAANRLPGSRVGEVIGRTGLDPVAGRRVAGFSLGMRQRLGIAGALLGDPRILLLDEPVNGLDPDGVRWVRVLARELAAEGRTVFMSSHLMGETARTADHLIIVGGGRLLADVGMNEFIERHAVARVRLVTPEPERLRVLLRDHGIAVKQSGVEDGGGELLAIGAEAATIGRIIAANQVTVSEISTRHGSLEEAFLRIAAPCADDAPRSAR
jgi:ABC-2 type transport system ATP-binding protein